jgi:predicted esterase
MWQAHGANLSFVEFDGGHEIPPPALQAMQSFIERHAR